jgi:paromamine 6'-oxidase/6'''-hydroxyneomycin C oxidase/2'-deamino-2'-hydroxyparomamine 6'-oxidase
MNRLRGPLPSDHRHAWHRLPLGSSHQDGTDGDREDRIYDVCIIGSGASGAVVADRLAQAGHDVLMIEEGLRLAPGVTNAELDRLCRRALIPDGAGGWTDGGWPWTTSNLGGGTVFYGGASFRYRPFDFDPSALIHVDGLDVRWPCSLNDMLPYYEAMERRLGVCGGDLTERDLSGNPVRRPAHPRSAAGSVLWSAGSTLGYHPIPTPLAINRDPYGGRPGCDQGSMCISYQCAVSAKGDVTNVFLKPLASMPNFTLRTATRALALEQDTANRVGAVQVVDRLSRRAHRYRARVFVLACNAIQTAALLLRSSSRHSPDGVGNQTDMVGRGLCMKLSEYVSGEVDPPPTSEGGAAARNGVFSTVSFLDHYLDQDCPTGVGGLIYEAKMDEESKFPDDALLVRVEAILADHPSPDNRVRLSDRVDEDGVPAVVIDYRPDPRDVTRLEYLVDRCHDLLRAGGAGNIRREPSDFAEGSTHLHGTCRAGDDPARSVVDRWGRIHTVDNVYVVDGGFMPYPGGLSPTLTIQANALRIADALSRTLVPSAGGRAHRSPRTPSVGHPSEEGVSTR